MVSIITGKKIELVDSLAQEIILNENLYLKLTQQLNDEGLSRKETITIGRRVGWYVLIRILKPRVVVETGVHHGVGACVISEALRRNQMEGFRGKYIGTEINSNHGKLFNQNYSDVGKIVYGDSIKTLSNLTEEIDIFINDSDHDSNYERNEYYAILKNLNKSSLVIGDNAHVSDELQKFSMDKGRHYLVFHEEPMGHWYPGGAIGMSIREIPTKEFQ